MSITVCGLDMGISNTSSICVLRGDKWNIDCVKIEAIQSISAPDLEHVVARYNAIYKPNLFIMELNGPGGTFAPYIERNQPQIPLATIDVATPLPEGYELKIWDDIVVDSTMVLNIRAAMYWILRLMFRDQKIKLYFDDEELEVQLGTLQWDVDTNRGDKIYMVNKKKLKFKSSELDSEPFSKSPDKADSLALAILAYTIIMQNEIDENIEFGQSVDENDIIDPITAGFFQLDQITEEAVN